MTFANMTAWGKKGLLLVILTLLTLISGAQHTDLNKNGFNGKDEDFNLVNGLFAEGNRFFETGDYFSARDIFQKAWSLHPSNALLNYKLGVCYFKTGEKYRSKDYFITALRSDTVVNADAYLYAGSCFQLESLWDSATVYYNIYLDKLNNIPFATADKKWAEKKKSECRNGIMLSKNRQEIIIKNLGPNINTRFAEYTPYITTDESKIFFTSRREGTTGNKADAHDGLYFEDIYMSAKVNDDWSPAVNAGTNINSKWHDAVCGIFPDGHTMIIFKGDVNNGDLFYVKYESGKWSKPVPFGNHVNTDYHESSACLSSDGQQLFFVSDKQGGFGGRDIYKSNWDASINDWGEAINLGATVNSAYDEEGVFLHPDNKTLFFASNGMSAIGGYDIMKSERKEDNWSIPVNLGIPINTPDDDVFVSVSANAKNIFFSSYRKDGYGEKDIYVATFKNADVKSPNLVVLKGEVVDETTNTPVEAHIDVVDLGKNEKIGTYYNEKETGKYLITLPGGRQYGTVVYAEGYIFESENVEVADTTSFAEINKKHKLKKISVGSVARMNNIFFETGKATILPASANELDRIAAMLRENAKLQIEIQGHSDNVGNADKNLELSTHRAEAVYHELIKRRINSQRLSFKGYGETKPAVSNDTDWGRSRNRRIEFWIVDDGH